jgi:hypothetical protein
MEPGDPPSDDNIPHEYVDVEIEALGVGNPTKESALRSELESLPGIVDMSVLNGRLAITYDPLFVTGAELLDAVKNAGFQIKLTETAAASPTTDAAVESGRTTTPPA